MSRSKTGTTQTAELGSARARLAASFALLGLGLGASTAAFAYVGPGAGFGILGVLLAVLSAIVMGFVGLVMWPIRKIAHYRKSRARAGEERDRGEPGDELLGAEAETRGDRRAGR